MKILIILLLILFMYSTSPAQTYIRNKGESKEKMVDKVLSTNSVKAGSTYEISDSASILLFYFEIMPQDTLSLNTSNQQRSTFKFGNSEFAGRPTLTLFEVLFSTDRIHYTRQSIDTLDVNSGCCPCHLPDIADSLQIIQRAGRQDLTLHMRHPVRFDCNSITSYYKLYYKDLIAAIRKGQFAMKATKEF